MRLNSLVIIFRILVLCVNILVNFPIEDDGASGKGCGVSSAFICEFTHKEKVELHHQVAQATIIPIILH